MHAIPEIKHALTLLYEEQIQPFQQLLQGLQAEQKILEEDSSAAA